MFNSIHTIAEQACLVEVMGQVAWASSSALSLLLLLWLIGTQPGTQREAHTKEATVKGCLFLFIRGLSIQSPYFSIKCVRFSYIHFSKISKMYRKVKSIFCLTNFECEQRHVVLDVIQVCAKEWAGHSCGNERQVCVCV